MEQDSVICMINELPNELILYILDDDDVPLQTLYRMAQTSHRFLYLAMEIYFARFQMTDPEEKCEIHLVTGRPMLDLLSGLRLWAITGSPRSVQSLTAWLDIADHDDPMGVFDYQIVRTHMERLHAFVENLESITEAKIIWTNSHCGCCNTGEENSYPEWLYLDSKVQLWADTVTHLLSTVVQKKCKSLTVSQGKYMVHTYAFKIRKDKPAKQSIFANLPKLRRMLSRRRASMDIPIDIDANVIKPEEFHWSRISRTGRGHISVRMLPGTRAAHEITSFSIESVMFAMPPLLHWTISILNLASLTSLTIGHMTLRRQMWASNLTLIALYAPHLTELTMTNVRAFNSADIVLFLNRLPLLRLLDIDPSVHFVDANTIGVVPSRWPVFTHIQHLRAPSKWVHPVLQVCRYGLTNLRTLSIDYDLESDDLRFWICPTPGKTIPSMLAASEDSRPPLSIAFQVRLGNKPLGRMHNDIRALDKLPKSSPVPMVECIHDIQLVFDKKLRGESMNHRQLAAIIPQWTSIFLYLRTLRIKTCNGSGCITHRQAVMLARLMMRSGGLGDMTSVEVDSEIITRRRK